MTAYSDFLTEKVNFDRSFGFYVPESDVSEILKPHQRDIVRWSVAGGRRAIFAAFGLGKSLMQLEILRLILNAEGGRGPIPLAGRRPCILALLWGPDADSRRFHRTEHVRADADVP